MELFKGRVHFRKKMAKKERFTRKLQSLILLLSKKLCLNTILAPGDGNLKKPVFKSSNARRVSGGGGGDVEAFELIDALTDKKTIWTEARAKPKVASWCVYMMAPLNWILSVASMQFLPLN